MSIHHDNKDQSEDMVILYIEVTQMHNRLQ